MYLANVDFDALIREDVPYFDLTSFELGLDHEPARIACFTRENCVVCGTEEAAEIFPCQGKMTRNPFKRDLLVVMLFDIIKDLLDPLPVLGRLIVFPFKNRKRKVPDD